MLNQRNTGPTCWLKGDSTAASVHVHTSNADFINRHAGTDLFKWLSSLNLLVIRLKRTYRSL